jgi:membrane dipeptidase
VSRYPYLLAELLGSGRWTEVDLQKLAGKNLIRVFKKVEEVSLSAPTQERFHERFSDIFINPIKP